MSEQRRKFLSSVAAAAESGTGSGFRATSATIHNMEDHKVKIQVFSVARYITYRVTHLLGKNLLLTWIGDVPPSCLGSRQLQ